MQTYTNCYYGEDLLVTKRTYVEEIQKLSFTTATVVWCSAGRDSSNCLNCDLWRARNDIFRADSPLEIDEYEEDFFPDQPFTELNFD